MKKFKTLEPGNATMTDHTLTHLLGVFSKIIIGSLKKDPYENNTFLCSAACVVVDSVSKKGCKDQESIQSPTTSDPGYHMGK